MTRSTLATRLALAAAVPLGAMVLSLGVAAAVDDDGSGTSVPASSTVGDLSGNCDEAEHSNDPGCSGGGATASPTTAVTVPTTGGVGGVDISGNCDEAEHFNDPECAGVAVPTAPGSAGGVDISGPCDEAEHANDPRCTGSVDDGSGDDDDDSSGHGSGDDDDDSSGHGSGDDDDDSSGHGSGGADDDSSGHGSGDD